MPGRHAKPIQLHLVNGNQSRLTAADIAERKTAEIRFGNKEFVPSDIVKKNKCALKKWNEIIGLYTQYNVDFVSTSDASIIERYCLTYAEYITLQAVRGRIEAMRLNKIETYLEISRLNLESDINKKSELLTKLEDRLILNPLSKIKVVPVQKKAIHEDKNKQLFGE